MSAYYEHPHFRGINHSHSTVAIRNIQALDCLPRDIQIKMDCVEYRDYSFVFNNVGQLVGTIYEYSRFHMSPSVWAEFEAGGIPSNTAHFSGVSQRLIKLPN